MMVQERKEKDMREVSLIDLLLEEGYPKEEIFHHGSDLYIFVTP